MKRHGSLGLGLALCAGALMVALAPNTSTMLGWISRLWPVLLLVAGIGSLIGFATKRQPKSPFTGGLLLAVGGLSLAFTLQSSTNPFEFFGRYWPILVAIVALSEILKHYTYKPEMGERPAILSVGKLSLVGLIVLTGVVSNRIAVADPNLLARLSMPAGLDKLRDSLFGDEFQFDAQTSAVDLPTGGQVVIENRFGAIYIEGTDRATVEASVQPKVRAYDQEAASRVAGKLRLVMEPTGSTLTVKTNRDEIDHEITTDLRILVPKTANLKISQSHGTITIRNVAPQSGNFDITASHAPIEISDVTSAITIDDAHDPVKISHTTGNVRISGRNDVNITAITGDIYIKDADDVVIQEATSAQITLDSVDHADIAISKVSGKDSDSKAILTIEGNHSDVVLRDIAGNARIQGNYGSVVAADIKGLLEVDAKHTEVTATRIGALTVETSYEQVEAREIAGAVNIQNDHGDVNVSEFAAECSIRTSFDDVKLENSKAPVDGVYVENEHGKIYLGLPLGPEYAIDSQVSRGKVRIDPKFSVSSASNEAKNRIVLKTSNDDIIVRPIAVQTAD